MGTPTKKRGKAPTPAWSEISPGGSRSSHASSVQQLFGDGHEKLAAFLRPDVIALSADPEADCMIPNNITASAFRAA